MKSILYEHELNITGNGNVNKILEIVNNNSCIQNNEFNITPEVCCEVYEIIMNRGLSSKIPEKMMELLDKNRDLQYRSNIDFSKSINEQQLYRETRVILALMYRTYICDDKKKEEYYKKDAEELTRIAAELRRKYYQNNT